MDSPHEHIDTDKVIVYTSGVTEEVTVSPSGKSADTLEAIKNNPSFARALGIDVVQ